MRLTLRQLEIFQAVALRGSTSAAALSVPLSQSATSAAVNELERVLGIPLFDTDISTVATRLNNPTPLLVVHDPDDPDSSYADSEHIVGAWPGATLVTTRGLGRLAHYRILRHRPAINAALEFISSAPKRLGADEIEAASS